MTDEREIIEGALQKEERLDRMKLLIAVISCQRDRESHELIRRTWAQTAIALGQLSPVDVRFFVGRGCEPMFADEIPCDVPDDWDGLPAKTQAACMWAVHHDYDFMFKTDTDSYV